MLFCAAILDQHNARVDSHNQVLSTTLATPPQQRSVDSKSRATCCLIGSIRWIFVNTEPSWTINLSSNFLFDLYSAFIHKIV
jgi:hypothetical protein